MDSKTLKADKPHAVCIPFPVQSHIKAMLKFSKLLHHKGFHITFVNTEFNHQRFLKFRGPNSLDGLSDFRFETIPDNLPPSDPNASQDVSSLFNSIMKNFLASFSNLLVKLNSATSNVPPVTCIISDGFMQFTIDAAQELGIPILMFFTISACSLMGYMQIPPLKDKGIIPLKGHRPILLSLDENAEHQRWRRKPFCFEAMWVEDPGCKEIITRAWDCTPDGTPMYAVTTKLKRCKKHLKAWSQDHFGNVLRQIKLVKEKLWKAEAASASSGNLEEIIHIWNHHGLPNPVCSKIISPRTDSSMTQVYDLFHPGTRIWDPGCLAACFLPWEAEMVARIPLCEDWDEDILIWPLTSDGEYSVSSAYGMLALAKNSSMPCSSSSNPSQAC
ncbi:hypothetical protein SO802_034057 [Lithocarpus litseifolius]|uniref:Glycosyltransferase N-terminal domain-containing protein n=1 Tax=Lithocarpus litseifolius TaxID=425828 RepID=A0AAW2BHJ2_9ROSI